MKAAPFAYHRADSVDGAVKLLAEYGDEAKILAGGQSLVPMLAMRLTHFENLVDISRVEELRSIDLVGDEVRDRCGHPARIRRDGRRGRRLGAAADDGHTAHRALPDPHARHPRRRHRARRPGREYAAVALALDATVEAVVAPRATRDPGRRVLHRACGRPRLQADEVLTAVRFPVWSGRCGFSVHEFARRHGDFAIAGATVAVELDGDDRVTRCGIGLLGLGSTPERGTPAEDAVVGRTVTELRADDIGALAMSGLQDVPTDLQGSASYRTRVGAGMVARAWTDAITEALDA